MGRVRSWLVVVHTTKSCPLDIHVEMSSRQTNEGLSSGWAADINLRATSQTWQQWMVFKSCGS